MDNSVILILGITFMASALTLMTGFGIGTILTPVFLLFFEVKVAILMVAVVHGLTNLFKVILFRQHVDGRIIRRFGLLSIIGAIVGGGLQIYLYSDVVKVILGLILIYLGIQIYLPKLNQVSLPQRSDFLGGFASGFLGGLVGNQGAIRSDYLINYPIKKEAFIATAALIACLVDVTRIPVYLAGYGQKLIPHIGFLATVVATAYLGTLVGKRMAISLSLEKFKKAVAGVIVLTGFLLAAAVL